MRFRVVVAGVVAGLVLASCGGDGRGRFDDEVATLRAAVDTGNRAAAEVALDDLRVDAVQAHVDGDLSDEEAVELIALVDRATALVDALVPATAAVPSEPEAEDRGDDGEDDDESDEDDDEEKGSKGKGKGRGEGRDDD